MFPVAEAAESHHHLAAVEAFHPEAAEAACPGQPSRQTTVSEVPMLSPAVPPALT